MVELGEENETYSRPEDDQLIINLVKPDIAIAI